ncbi:acyl-CoA thioesterase [Nonomuraea sp. NPDC004354]
MDTDASGVLHFARYASLLETAVLENLDRLGFGLGWLGLKGFELVVAELQMKYVRPARYADTLRIATTVEHVGGAAFRLAGTLCRDGRTGPEEDLLARGRLVMCVARRTDGLAVPLPDEVRYGLQACLAGGSDD